MASLNETEPTSQRLVISIMSVCICAPQVNDRNLIDLRGFLLRCYDYVFLISDVDRNTPNRMPTQLWLIYSISVCIYLFQFMAFDAYDIRSRNQRKRNNKQSKEKKKERHLCAYGKLKRFPSGIFSVLSNAHTNHFESSGFPNFLLFFLILLLLFCLRFILQCYRWLPKRIKET